MNPGDRINHYEIVSALGAGGMGEVYVALDTTLDRRVALKVLPEDLAADPERRERFEREAKAIAALNHANIVTIHTVEESAEPAGDAAAGANLHFLTMELVEGQTLTELIPPNGLTLERFFNIAIPLADALSAAHQKGIAHRDLKPSNVMVTDEGVVKLLDFGLAKLFEEPDAEADVATQMATGHGADLTEEGKVLGTVAYMSPEQAEGKAVDHRSDVFSLGIILYEMVTGQRPFSGDTKLSVMSSIVKDEPAPVTDANVRLPRHLGRIIKRALEKDVNRRFQTALDLRNELEDLKGEVDSGAVLATGATPALGSAGAGVGGNRLVQAAAAAIVIGGAAIGWWVLSSAPATDETPELSVTTRGIAVSAAEEFSPAISPDGQWVVFGMLPEGPVPEGMPPGATQPPDLFQQRIDGQNRVNLTNTPMVAEFYPRYSPDGTQIAYMHQGPDGEGIYVMGATGENPRRVADGNATPSWSPDGTKLYVGELGFQNPRAISGTSEIRTIDIESGEVQMVFAHDGWSALQPDPSPNGHRIAFWGLSPAGGQRDIYTIPATGGDPVPVTNDPAVDWSPLWSPDGNHLYFGSERAGSMNIWRVPIDEVTGETLGNPEQLTSGGLGDQGIMTISADGTRLAYMEFLERSHVIRASFDPETATIADDGVQISAEPVRVTSLSPSLDGTRLAYVSYAGQQDLFVVNIDGTNERRITNDAAKEWRPNWMADNETIVYYADAGGPYDLWSIRADGGQRHKIAATPGDEMAMAASPDGRYAVVVQRGVDTNLLIGIGDDPDAATVTAMPPLPESSSRFGGTPHWAPDGSAAVSYGENDTGIYLYDPETNEYRRLTEGGFSPRFTHDGRILFARAQGPFFEWRLMDPETLEEQVISSPDIGIFQLFLLPDGETVVYVHQPDPEYDVWLLEIEEGGR